MLGVSVALGWGRGGSRRWKQEVAAGARAGHASAYWQRWVTIGTGQVGRPAQVRPRWASPSLSFSDLFSFSI